MNLKSLNQTELNDKLKSLAAQERALLHEILLVIKEVDGRRMYLDFGYGSLFDYLVKGIGYSEGSAQRRIDAARLLKEIPQVGEMIARGRIHLNQISLVQKTVRSLKLSNKPVPTKIEKELILNQIAGKSTQQSQQEVASFFDLPVLEGSRLKVQADQSVRLEMTLSQEDYETVKRAQSLVSHNLSSQALTEFVVYLSKKIIQQKVGDRHSREHLQRKSASAIQLAEQEHSHLLQERTLQGRLKAQSESGPQEKSTTEIQSIAPRSPGGPVETIRRFANRNQNKEALMSNDKPAMHLKFTKPDNQLFNSGGLSEIKNISLPVKKAVLHKSHCCQFKLNGAGKVCGSTWRLQVDHKTSRHAGGNHQISNLQVLCGKHNLHKYKKETGQRYLS